MSIIQEQLGAAAIVFKKEDGQPHWLLIRACGENCWKFPKQISTKAESTVRTCLRKIERVAGSHSQVLEEVGRARVSVDAGKTSRPALTIYYLLRNRKSDDIPFAILDKGEIAWLSFQSAYARLALETEKKFLSTANRLLRQIDPSETPV